MTFKKLKFEDSLVMKSFAKIAYDKNLANVQEDELDKKFANIIEKSKKADYRGGDNFDSNVLKLCSGLREAGMVAYANELESNFLEYKRASKGSGDKLIDSAHSGSAKLDDLSSKEALIEDIFDQHLKMMDVFESEPKGKLASHKDILSQVKRAQSVDETFKRVDNIEQALRQKYYSQPYISEDKKYANSKWVEQNIISELGSLKRVKDVLKSFLKFTEKELMPREVKTIDDSIKNLSFAIDKLPLALQYVVDFENDSIKNILKVDPSKREDLSTLRYAPFAMFKRNNFEMFGENNYKEVVSYLVDLKRFIYGKINNIYSAYENDFSSDLKQPLLSLIYKLQSENEQIKKAQSVDETFKRVENIGQALKQNYYSEPFISNDSLHANSKWVEQNINPEFQSLERCEKILQSFAQYIEDYVQKSDLDWVNTCESTIVNIVNNLKASHQNMIGFETNHVKTVLKTPTEKRESFEELRYVQFSTFFKNLKNVLPNVENYKKISQSINVMKKSIYQKIDGIYYKNTNVLPSDINKTLLRLISNFKNEIIQDKKAGYKSVIKQAQVPPIKIDPKLMNSKYYTSPFISSDGMFANAEWYNQNTLSSFDSLNKLSKLFAKIDSDVDEYVATLNDAERVDVKSKSVGFELPGSASNKLDGMGSRCKTLLSFIIAPALKKYHLLLVGVEQTKMNNVYDQNKTTKDVYTPFDKKQFANVPFLQKATNYNDIEWLLREAKSACLSYLSSGVKVLNINTKKNDDGVGTALYLSLATTLKEIANEIGQKKQASVDSKYKNIVNEMKKEAGFFDYIDPRAIAPLIPGGALVAPIIPIALSNKLVDYVYDAFQDEYNFDSKEDAKKYLKNLNPDELNTLKEQANRQSSVLLPEYNMFEAIMSHKSISSPVKSSDSKKANSRWISIEINKQLTSFDKITNIIKSIYDSIKNDENFDNDNHSKILTYIQNFSSSKIEGVKRDVDSFGKEAVSFCKNREEKGAKKIDEKDTKLRPNLDKLDKSDRFLTNISDLTTTFPSGAVGDSLKSAKTFDEIIGVIKNYKAQIYSSVNKAVAGVKDKYDIVSELESLKQECYN